MVKLIFEMKSLMLDLWLLTSIISNPDYEKYVKPFTDVWEKKVQIQLKAVRFGNFLYWHNFKLTDELQE